MRILFAGFSLFLATIASAETSGIAIELPNEPEWVQVTDQFDQQSYLKEWVPKGKSAEDTDWIVSQQKFVLAKKTTAKKYISETLKLAALSCTDVKFNGPEKRNVQNADSYWARLMCAQVIGKDYGTFTELRVVIDGNVVFVATSEVHLAPTNVAGVFTLNDPSKIKQTMGMLEASAKIARDGVRMCTADAC